MLVITHLYVSIYDMICVFLLFYRCTIADCGLKRL